jgi:hypothetical protein
MGDRDADLHVRLPSKLLRELKRAADRDGRSLSAYVVLVLSGQLPPPGVPSAGAVER